MGPNHDGEPFRLLSITLRPHLTRTPPPLQHRLRQCTELSFFIILGFAVSCGPGRGRVWVNLANPEPPAYGVPTVQLLFMVYPHVNPINE
jgi:hypothetical protein